MSHFAPPPAPPTHTHTHVMSLMSCPIYEWVMSHINDSCHTCFASRWSLKTGTRPIKRVAPLSIPRITPIHTKNDLWKGPIFVKRDRSTSEKFMTQFSRSPDHDMVIRLFQFVTLNLQNRDETKSRGSRPWQGKPRLYYGVATISRLL